MVGTQMTLPLGRSEKTACAVDGPARTRGVRGIRTGVPPADPIEIFVDNRARLRPDEIPTLALEDLVDAFSHHNTHRETMRVMGVPHWGEPAIIRTWCRDGDEITFPRGGLARVRKILGEHGVPFRIRDRRNPGSGERLEATSSVDLRGYQREARDALEERENALLRAATGCGKTCIALALAAELGAPTLVVVWSAALLKQWVRRIEKELGIPAREVGLVQGNERKWRLAPITVGMQQTVSSAFRSGRGTAIADYFGCVMMDEVTRAAAQTCFDAIDPFPARYRFGISASEKRKDRKEFLIYDLFGDVAYEIGKKDLLRQGAIVDVEARVVPTSFEAPWYGVPDDEDETQSLDTDRLLEEMTHDPTREALLRSVVAEESARGQVLVLSHRREHCLRLHADLTAGGTPSSLLLGGADYAGRFDVDLARFEAGETRVAVGTYQAVGTGIDIPGVATGVAATPIAGNRGFYDQVWGRFCRAAAGKANARLYTLWDRNVHPRHLENLRRWNQRAVLRGDDGEWQDLKLRRPRGMR